MNDKNAITQLKDELHKYIHELNHKFIDSAFDDNIYIKLEELKKVFKMVDRYEQN